MILGVGIFILCIYKQVSKTSKVTSKPSKLAILLTNFISI